MPVLNACKCGECVYSYQGSEIMTSMIKAMKRRSVDGHCKFVSLAIDAT